MRILAAEQICANILHIVVREAVVVLQVFAVVVDGVQDKLVQVKGPAADDWILILGIIRNPHHLPVQRGPVQRESI
jgi:hypothetical protein